MNPGTYWDFYMTIMWGGFKVFAWIVVGRMIGVSWNIIQYERHARRASRLTRE